ncbi:MAG: DsbC family protein [Xanthomonadaceae bacterium]|jgi:thiol:disulfide interchange protein DsbC|nr:DsbC family protein [Xanthomonadaceae bacterium]
MFRLLVTALLGVFSLSACAQSSVPSAAAPPANDAGAEQRVWNALKEISPQFQPSYIGAAAFPGFQEVLIGGQLLYVSNDGRYLLQQAQPIDLQARAPVVSTGLMNYRRSQLAEVPASDRIVFAPAHPRYTISVFTDVECGFCRKLHQDIPELNRRGIAVEYLAFPRLGLSSPDYREMVSVWCASDRKQALTDAKSGKPVADATCENPVAREYEIGQRMGITGTPAIFAPDGTLMGGYLEPGPLEQMLQQRAAATAGESR